MNAWSSETTPTSPTGDTPPHRRRLPLDRAFMALILVLQLVILVFLILNRRQTGAPSRAGDASLATDASRPHVAASLGVERDWLPLDAHVASLQADLDRQLSALLCEPMARYGAELPVPSLRLRHPTDMDRLMHNAWANFRAMETLVRFDEGWGDMLASPTLDMRDNNDQYVVVCTLPGLPADAVRVLLNGRLLTIRTEESPPGARATRRFERHVMMPGPVAEAASAQACWTNGVLRIAIPKAGQSRDPAAEARL